MRVNLGGGDPASADVQPAAGVSIMITMITGGGGTTEIRGNSSGTETGFALKTNAVGGISTSWVAGMPIKLFITNSEYITLRPGGQTEYAYCGIEL